MVMHSSHPLHVSVQVTVNGNTMRNRIVQPPIRVPCFRRASPAAQDLRGTDRKCIALDRSAHSLARPVHGVSIEFVRRFLLFLSRQKHLRRWMETSPAAQRLATRFIAGQTLEDALAAGRKINSEGITLTLDVLGESVTTLDEAAAARDAY